MSVNGITNSSKAYDSRSTAKTNAGQNKKENTPSSNDSTAAVYEKSEPVSSKKTYKTDTATVERLKAEADKRSQNLRNLVEKMLTKQGQTFTDSTDIYSLLRQGKVDVDPETRAQAQKDIAQDGYWGVEQTSERMLSFAKALSGGDISKANEMIDAVKKGFEQATKAWGGELPGICKTTMDKTIEKLEAWRDGKDVSKATDMAATVVTGQATAKTIAD